MIRCAMNFGSDRYMFNGIRVLSVLYVVIRSPLQKYCHTSEWLTPSARLHKTSNGTDSTRPNAHFLFGVSAIQLTVSRVEQWKYRPWAKEDKIVDLR